MKTMNNREFKKFFKVTYPSFSNAKIKNFKKVVTYPNSGSIRFQVNLDKNGQVYDIHQSFVSIIRDVETKKRYVKVTLGDRPRLLFERIYGRPFELITPWIDNLIEEMQSEK